MSDRETAAEIEDVALAWIWRLDREGERPDLMEELDHWLAGDHRRRGAFLQAQATWNLLDLAGTDADAVMSAEAPGPTPFARRWLLAGAPALAAACAIGAVAWETKGDGYRTATGEIRRVPLRDGSQVALNTQSRINVQLGRSGRTVNLSAGEAWFHVARDATRPFVVEAGNVRVRAVGTAFSVRLRDSGADVLVTEGVVEAWTIGGEARRVRLTAGAAAFVSASAAIIQNGATTEIDRKLAWRDGKIDFRGESLATAVADFNRYNRQQLVIADPRIATEPFFGVFSTEDPVGFATAVAASLNIVATTDSDGTIELGRRTS